MTIMPTYHFSLSLGTHGSNQKLKYAFAFGHVFVESFVYDKLKVFFFKTNVQSLHGEKRKTHTDINIQHRENQKRVSLLVPFKHVVDNLWVQFHGCVFPSTC